MYMKEEKGVELLRKPEGLNNIDLSLTTFTNSAHGCR